MQSAVCLLSRAAERLKVLGTYSTVQILPNAVYPQHSI
jgi:hypothetical protein